MRLPETRVNRDLLPGRGRKRRSSPDEELRAGWRGERSRKGSCRAPSKESVRLHLVRAPTCELCRFRSHRRHRVSTTSGTSASRVPLLRICARHPYEDGTDGIDADSRSRTKAADLRTWRRSRWICCAVLETPRFSGRLRPNRGMRRPSLLRACASVTGAPWRGAVPSGAGRRETAEPAVAYGGSKSVYSGPLRLGCAPRSLAQCKHAVDAMRHACSGAAESKCGEQASDSERVEPPAHEPARVLECRRVVRLHRPAGGRPLLHRDDPEGAGRTSRRASTREALAVHRQQTARAS